MEGKVISIHYRDMSSSLEKPRSKDDETAAKLALAIGSQGNVRTETLRAFTEKEYLKIFAALP